MSSTHTVRFCGEELIADADAGLYWPRQRLLAVADLHFEKGSAFGERGTFLPPYDSRSTLQRLDALVHRYDPQQVVCLGDSFHDTKAGDRMDAADREALSALVAERDWVWIVGNHDPVIQGGLGTVAETVLEIGPLRFRHEAAAGIVNGEISGHFHPKARIKSRGRVLSCRCFASDARRMILPAFGAYTGGFNVLDSAFERVLGRRRSIFAVRRGSVYSVDPRRLVAEPEPQPTLL